MMICGRSKSERVESGKRSTSIGSSRHGKGLKGKEKIKGTVVLMKKNVLDITDVTASLFDRIHELFGKGVSLQLISADNLAGKLGKATYLENWVAKITPLTAEETTFEINFEWDEKMGVPGGFIIKNYHHSEFYLRTVTLDVPGHDSVHFVCNSWVYPTQRYKYNRVFFSNKVTPSRKWIESYE